MDHIIVLDHGRIDPDIGTILQIDDLSFADCIVLAGRGLSNKAIARKLSISPITVDRYLKDARRSFGVTSRAELLWAAMLAGEIDPGEAR